MPSGHKTDKKWGVTSRSNTPEINGCLEEVSQPLYHSNFEDLYFGPCVLAPGQPFLEPAQPASANTNNRMIHLCFIAVGLFKRFGIAKVTTRFENREWLIVKAACFPKKQKGDGKAVALLLDI